MRVDLNADVGEQEIGADDELLDVVTSANIACGVHAGSSEIMRYTLRAAAARGVAAGAHPGFGDRAGFGRSEISAPAPEIFEAVRRQIDALRSIARQESVTLRHVKPHGALYNLGARRSDVADAIAEAVAACDSRLLLFALYGSELEAAGLRAGLRVAAEGFADRSYERDGSLTPRQMPGAVIANPLVAAERAVSMAKDQMVIARDGTPLRLAVDTICVHADTPDALAIAREIREALVRSGIMVAAGL